MLDWHGGPAPVHPRSRVDAVLRDGFKFLNVRAKILSAMDSSDRDYWRHIPEDSGCDIVAYGEVK